MRSANNLLQNGRYHLVRVIGQGGMGAVYEAYDQNLNYRVAVKQVLGGHSGPALVQEGQRLVRLRHSALPDVKNHFVEGQGQYLVMEYIEGHDLAMQLEQQAQPFGVGEVLIWADQLLDALIYLHGQNPPLIHRDIKLANLKLTPDGQIILLDFGLAKGGLTQYTMTPSLHGYTLAYAPPEQIAGTGTDELSDLYALGATLYHLLTGQAPENALQRHAQSPHSDPLRPANQLNPQIPAHVADALSAAMALDPAQRPASAVEMRAMLAQSPKPDKDKRQNRVIAATPQRWVALLIGVLLLVMLGGLATVLCSWNECPIFPISPAGSTISTDNASQIEPLARLGQGKIEQIAISPNSDLLAVTSSVGIYLYDAQTLEQRLLIESEGWLTGVVFSPDGQIVAAGSRNRMVYLWQVDGSLLATLKGHTSGVTSVAYSPDGQLLASGSSDKTVRLWQVPQAESESGNRYDPYLTTLEVGTSVSSVAFSPDGQLLATASSNDSKIHLWQTSDGTVLRTFVGHEASNGVNKVAFTPDGQSVASASSDNTVRLWQVSDGTLSQTLEHPTNVRSLAISPDGQTLASTVDDSNVYLWRLSDGTPSGVLDRHTNKVPSVAFSPDGQTLITASFDNTLRLWDTASRRLQKTQTGYSSSVTSVAVSPNGQWLASGTGNATVVLWESSDGTLLKSLEGHTSRVTSVAFSPDGSLLASGSEDQSVRLWDIPSGTLSQSLEGHTDYTDQVTSLAFRPDDQLIAFGSTDGTLSLWQLDDLSLHTLEGPGHTDRVTSVAFSPDGTLLASGSTDDTVRLWQVSDRTLLATLEGHSYGVSSVAFSPNGVLLASGSSDGTVRISQLPDGQLLTTLDRHNQNVTTVAFSPDDQTIAAGSSDGNIYLWRISDRMLLTTLPGHSSRVNRILFTPDGKILSGSEDGTLRLWGLPP
ncbi:MAG: WD40 repeat domain-containing serine/threonine protein kinase [Ardenticatenaceae bacterium]